MEKSRKDEMIIECGIILGKDGSVSIKRETKKIKFKNTALAIDSQLELLSNLKSSIKENQKIVDLMSEVDDQIAILPSKTFTSINPKIKNMLISKLAMALQFPPKESDVNSQIIGKIENIHELLMVRNLPAAWASAKSTKRILKKIIEKMNEKIDLTSKTIVILESLN